MTFSVPCPSASGARYLTNNELRNNETGRNQKKFGCCAPCPVLHARIFRKKVTAPPTMTPAIVARKTHLMMLKNRTVDSVNDFLMVDRLIEFEYPDRIFHESTDWSCTQTGDRRRLSPPNPQRRGQRRVERDPPANYTRSGATR